MYTTDVQALKVKVKHERPTNKPRNPDLFRGVRGSSKAGKLRNEFVLRGLFRSELGIDLGDEMNDLPASDYERKHMT